MDRWCIPQVDGTYVARMEDVLDLYAEEAVRSVAGATGMPVARFLRYELRIGSAVGNAACHDGCRCRRLADSPWRHRQSSASQWCF